jgi:hypothetical protein
LERRNEELERLIGQDNIWKYGIGTAGNGNRSLRRSLSND